MKKMAAGMFKSHCLAAMDQVKNTREPLLITKRGKPVAKLVPVEQTSKEFLGRLQGTMEIVGDIESPLHEPQAWEVLR